MKRKFRIDLFDQTKYRLETTSGMRVIEYVVLKSDVLQPVICVVKNSIGDEQVASYTIDGSYNPGKPTTWDLVMVPIAPYVSDDFQIGPNGAYEHVEQVKMPIREHCETAIEMRLYKETGKSMETVKRILKACNGNYEPAYKLLTLA
jgi:hypothetical protein